MGYETIDVRFEKSVCRVRLDRADAGNALNARMVEELSAVVAHLRRLTVASNLITILVLEGAAGVFCSGGDFEAHCGRRGTRSCPAL